MTKQTRNPLYAIWKFNKFNSVHSPSYVIGGNKVNEPLAKGTITPGKIAGFNFLKACLLLFTNRIRRIIIYLVTSGNYGKFKTSFVMRMWGFLQKLVSVT